MTVLTSKTVKKDIKSKRQFVDNHIHDILRLFDSRASFFYTSEMKRDYQ